MPFVRHVFRRELLPDQLLNFRNNPLQNAGIVFCRNTAILDSLRRAGIRAMPLGRVLDAARELKPGDVVLTLGAGDVWKIGDDLLRRRRGGSAVGV